MAKKQQCPPPGLPMWMATYADMVTLLLTFFVALLSMADLDKAKYDKAKSSIKEAFGVQAVAAPAKDAIPILPASPRSRFMPIAQQSALQTYKKLKTDLERTKINEDVQLVQRDAETVVLTIRDSVLFEPGKAAVTPAAHQILRKVADIIRPLPMQLRIEGHTDDSPLVSTTMNNWDLSVARSVAVMDFFQRHQLFSLDRMAAVGYGDQRPAQPNTSEENKAQNRRVEFVLRSNLLPGSAPRAEPPI
ncbi:MAG: flagellar motor protein MotB [Desulfobulbaceae bacterium A2]|nr:MAG: flagellar motor protein MotB [Desulfobulbaceae bacterium A2]